MKIGNLKLKNRIFLAPMVEVNDIAFRILCKKSGAELVYTGMINPLSKQKLELQDKPALQIFCTNSKGVKEFIKKYEKKVKLFDFNLGCPAKTAKKLGFGIYMNHDLEAIEKILRIMRESTKKPVLVKLRKSKNALKIAKIANKYCDAIAIHPRTKEKPFSGIPDINFALKIKKISKIPIIYSGDVDEKNYKKYLEFFDFVMVGRKAIGNPNIFGKIVNKETNFTYNSWLHEAEKCKIPFKQYKSQAMWFTKGQEGGAEIRNRLAKAKTVREIKKILKI